MKVTGGQEGRNLPGDLQKFKNGQYQKGVINWKGGYKIERRLSNRKER